MNKRIFVLIILIVIISILVVKYSISLFLGTRGESIFSIQSDAMVHDELTETRHYQFLEKNFNYGRSYIDSWPIKNGLKIDDKILVKEIECKDISVGKVIVFYVPGSGKMPPIVHRVIQIREDNSFLTKGDHNPSLDPWKITCENIVGEVISVIE